MEQRIRARYRMETSLPAAQAAEAVAGEQSTGTFTRIPGETDELRERHGARVESVVQVGDLASEVEISWPLSNMGPSLPNLLAAVGGNLWEMKQFSRPAGIFIDQNDNIYVADSDSPPANHSHDGWRRGIRIGSLKDGTVVAYIPDPVENPTGTHAAEGVAVDAKGNVYGAEVGNMALKRYERK